MSCKVYYYREPAIQPIKIKRWADWRFAIQIFTDRARTTTLDLTGYAGTAEIRNSDTGALVQTITVTISVPATAGAFVLFISSANTKLLPLQTSLRYDVFFDNGSDRFCPIQGNVLIDQNITA